MPVFTGTNGNDSLIGGSGDDTLTGLAGNDTLRAGAGNDVLDGGDGADVFILDQATDSNGDTITGGEGGLDLDRIDASALPAGTGVYIALSTAEAGRINSTAGAPLATFTQIEQFVLSTANDVFIGLDSVASAVNVDGGAGADWISGTGAADTLTGGAGADTLKGGGGADSLSGGADDDALFGGEGNDTIDGGDGNDLITEGGGTAAGTRAFSWLNTFDGADPLLGGQQTLINGAPGAVNLTGDANTDKEYVFVQANSQSHQGELDINPELMTGERVQSVSMSLTLDMGSAGNADWVDGFSFSLGDPTSVTGERENGVAEGLAVRLDPLSNILEIRWNGVAIASQTVNNLETRAAGTLSVNVTSAGVVSVQLPTSGTVNLTATIPGGQWTTQDQSGWQFVFAGRTGANAGYVYIDDVNLSATINTPATTGGSDSLLGGLGNDTIIAGAGADTLVGGAGNDSLTGGDGDDRFVLSNGDGSDTIAGGEAGETLGDLLDASAVTANSTLTLTATETGTLVIGADTVSFSQIERFALGSGNDSVTGSSGADSVDGGAGNDTLCRAGPGRIRWPGARAMTS